MNGNILFSKRLEDWLNNKQKKTGDDARIRNSGLGFFMDSPGFTLVQNFDGSYTGAMGLPMEIVRKNIKTLKYKNV